MYKGEKYTSGTYLFPSDEIAPMKKRKGESSKEFCLQFAKAFYAGWGNGNFAYSRFVERDSLINLRMYGRGQQDNESNYDFWYGRNEANQVIRKGAMNINWEILPAVLKFKDSFMARLNENEFVPRVYSQDDFTIDEKQRKAMVDMVKKQMASVFGSAPKAEDGSPIPASMKQFEIFDQIGLNKTQAEYLWEKLINFTFNGINNWDLKMKNRLLEDIFSLGRLCVRDFVDPDTQTIKVQYIDPINTIMRLTSNGDVIDGGFIELMTVQDLKKASGLDEATLFAIAQSASGWYGNPGNSSNNGADWKYGSSYEWYLSNLGGAVPRTSVGNCEWYAFRVPVLHCEYRSVDTDYYRETEKEADKKIYSRDTYGKVFKNSPTKRTLTKNTINYYTCSWIIGTDHCYDYGLQYDAARPERAEAKCSFHYYQMEDPSIVRRMKPALDLVQNSWVYFQNEIAKAKPDGYLFDISVLKNANVGEKVKPKDLIKGIMQTGSGIFSSTAKRTNLPINPHMGSPVIPLPGGVEKAINSFAMNYNVLQQVLSDMSGMTPSFTGGSEIPEGARVNAGQDAASQSLLKPKVDAYKFVRESVSLNILLRGQVIFRHNEKMIEQYKGILGATGVEILREVSKKNYSQYGMKMDVKTSGTLYNDIRNMANIAMQPGKNGEPGINFTEYITIMTMLDNNIEVKFIQAYLQSLVDERQRKFSEQQMMMQDNQNKGLMQMEQQKGMMADALLTKTTDEKIRETLFTEAIKYKFEVMKMPEQAMMNATDSALNAMIEATVNNLMAQNGGQQTAA